jgi:hypothetical protein
MENFEQKINPSQDPKAYIEAMKATINPWGRNNYEWSDFDKITSDLDSGKITAEEAMRQAQSMVDSKQDYN